MSIRDVGPYTLADLADCAGPDGETSPGAVLLLHVRDDTVEYYNQYPDATDGEWGDARFTIADQAPCVYTHNRWLEFIDLCAYNEDPTHLGGGGSDMTTDAGPALHRAVDEPALIASESIGLGHGGTATATRGLDHAPSLVVGSGTTLQVATGHGRDAIGIDLDERNADLARERVGMFLTVESVKREEVG